MTGSEQLPGGVGGYILLVEDNPFDVDLTLRAFAMRQQVIEVRVARDGAEAVALLERWHAGERLPALVLLDLKLPKRDGIEVLEAFRADSLTRYLPVVMLTSSSETRDMERAYSAGANSYIAKPVSFQRFTEMADDVAHYWFDLNLRPGARP